MNSASDFSKTKPIQTHFTAEKAELAEIFVRPGRAYHWV